VTRESEAEEIELDEDDLESVAGGVSWDEFRARAERKNAGFVSNKNFLEKCNGGK
jgi:hypothetical protein